MLEIKRNPDKTRYQQMTEAVKKNNGYCPCLVERNEDTKCMCKPFREQKTEGPCYCGRFIKVEKPTVEPSQESKDKILRENIVDVVMSENNTQKVNERIEEIYEGMKDLNVYKNTQYGNIGSEPLNLFAKYMSKETPALNGIYQRLDDKLSRVKNCPDEKPRVNDVCDIMGYLNLLLVNMGVTKEEIAKFKD